MRLRDPAIVAHFPRQDAQDTHVGTFVGSFDPSTLLARNERNGQPETNRASTSDRTPYAGYLKNGGLNGLRSSPNA